MKTMTLVARHLLATGELIYRFLTEAQDLTPPKQARKRRTLPK